MIQFKLIGDAYVPFGAYTVTEKKFVKGQHHVQGLGQVIGVTATGDVPPALLKDYPIIFNLESFQLQPFFQGDLSGDISEGNIGISPYTKKIEIPKFRLVTLLHKIDTDVSTSVETVEFDASFFTSPALASTALTNLLTKTWSVQEYTEEFSREGFNRNGGAASSILPRGVAKSAVDSLTHFGGSNFKDASGTVLPSGIRVCFGRQNVTNSLPLFDVAYLEGYGILNDKDTLNQSQIPGALIRWRGGIPSESRQLIGHGVAIPMGSNIAGQNLPLVEQNLVIDGVTYLGANDGNVTRTFR